MARPLVYDAMGLIAQMALGDATGIDRIDLTYAQYFAYSRRAELFAAHCGWKAPHVMSADMLRHIVRKVEARWCEDRSDESDPALDEIEAWLKAELPRHRQSSVRLERPGRPDPDWRSHVPFLYARVAGMGKSLPHGAIYLKVTEHGLEYERFFRWRDQRPDVRTIFFVHDLLPLDYPEYFGAGYRPLFERRVETLCRWGDAFMVSTHAVGERLAQALALTPKTDRPIHVAAFPSPLSLVDAGGGCARSPGPPYFVLLSTIEPRKNHLLALNIWRELAAGGRKDIPKLVLVGGQGWEHEQVDDILDRCELIRGHVLHARRLSGVGLARLLKGAQALLMPSFGEGYGLPVVEALSLGTPAIASDIAAFREVTQGCAILLSPLDGVGWKEAIHTLSNRNSSAWQAAAAKAACYRKPDWPSYFNGVESFMNAL